MKKLIILSILLLGVGCSNPLKSFWRASKKVDVTEQKIDKNKNEIIKKAQGTAWAVDYTLSLKPDPDRYTITAQSLNQRTETVLGAPDLSVIKEYQKIVDGLVSTNETLRKEAKGWLDKRDSEIIRLQKEKDQLEIKLLDVEAQKDEISASNSVLADKWVKLWRWIKIVFWVVIIGVGLAILSQILSVALPQPYGSIFGIMALVFGTVGRFIFKLIPSSQKYAAVVSEKDHSLSENTLSQLVQALQKARNKEITQEDVAPNNDSIKLAELLDPILKETLDEFARKKVIQKKIELNHV
ncbi:MAG: hypothetical protein AABY07_08070 [Nanoarchaeota archaeon]